MPEELNKCTVLLDADMEDDLERQVQGLKVEVPPRVQDPATNAREQWQMHYLLRALLAARQLVLPVRLYKREAPDFVLQTGDIRIGVETIEAINPDYVRAQVHPAAQVDHAVVDPSLYKWGTQGRPKSQIREEAGRTQLTGHPWMRDSVEQEFAQSIKDVVLEKNCKFHSHYTRFDINHLLIYHNQPSPQIHIDKARVYTADILVDYWNQLGFDAVYVHKCNSMLSFTRGASEIVCEFPRSDAPFGIDADIWGQLSPAKKIYLKLLEQEPDFVSYTSTSEPGSELDDLFGLESELQALRREWLVNRDRELERMGYSALLQPPDRDRLRTVSELGACPATMELFHGGVLEHVLLAVAESIDDATITGLQQTMACRDSEFAASVTAILRYLSRFKRHLTLDVRFAEMLGDSMCYRCSSPTQSQGGERDSRDDEGIEQAIDPTLDGRFLANDGKPTGIDPDVFSKSA